MEKEPLVEKTLDKPGTDRFSLRYMLIVPPIMMYYIAFGTMFYTTNEWIQHSVKSQIFTNVTYNSSSVCTSRNESNSEKGMYERVESDTARWQMLASVGVNIPGILSSAILPAYSDCFGRRFVLICGATGSVVKSIICTAAIYFNMSPIYIVVGSVVDGVGGSYFSIYSGYFSYAADITDGGRRRSFAMAILDGIIMISITCAGLGAGYFIQLAGFLISMVTSFGLLALATLILVLIVPESYPKHARSKRLSVCAIIKRTFDFYLTDTFKEKRTAYLILIFAYILENLENQSRASVEMLYQLGRPFCWSAEKIGIFSALRHIAQGFAGIILIKPLQTHLSDLNIAIGSLAFGVGSFVLEGLASTNLILYMVPVLATFSFLCESMIKSLMSTMTPSDIQGSLFASIVMAQGVCGTCANFLFNTVYANTVSFMSGFVFFVMAGLASLSMLALIVYAVSQRNNLKSELKVNEQFE